MESPTLLLLRHASAGSRSDWTGDDALRPLDELGREQALALPDRLDGVRTEPVRMVSSPMVRCRATLEPLAAAWGAQIEVDERLAERLAPVRSDDGWPDAAWLGARALAAVDGAIASETRLLVVCTHGEVLPALLAALLGRADQPAPVGATAPDLTSKALPKAGGWLVRFDPRPVVDLIPAPR